MTTRFRRSRNKTVTINLGGGGLGIGAFIATCLSWGVNHSIAWAIFHFLCGWWYVAYYAFFR